MLDVRPLVSGRDTGLVHDFYQAAPDYWQMADGRAPDRAKAAEFFTDCPPGSDITQSWHLGVFLDDRLSGVAEMSFGFPEAGDAYLGLFLLGPWARGQGHGAAFLQHLETRLRKSGHQKLFLAVIHENKRGFAFWRREGFLETGKTGQSDANGVMHTLSRLVKAL